MKDNTRNVLVFLQLELMKLVDRIREVMRFKHYSLSTEESYVGWYRRFVKFHELRHPKDMGAAEVESFLTDLAVQRNVVAATQNQALNALVFLFKEVLDKRHGAGSVWSPLLATVPYSLQIRAALNTCRSTLRL